MSTTTNRYTIQYLSVLKLVTDYGKNGNIYIYIKAINNVLDAKMVLKTHLHNCSLKYFATRIFFLPYFNFTIFKLCLK